MVRKILQIAFILAVVVVLSWLFLVNREVVPVTYFPGKTLQTRMALVLVVTFFGGVLATAAVGLVIGIRYKFERWRETQRHKTLKSHEKLMVSAREALAVGNFDKAKNSFEKIIQSDPDNIVARIMLAKNMLRQGDSKKAIQVLDNARVEQQKNGELLFLAADINSHLGNYTAAHDNIALVLRLEPNNIYALQRLVEYTSNLQRYEDAIDYQQRLIRLYSTESDKNQAQEKLAELELQSALKLHSSKPESLRPALEEVRRKHKDFAPVLSELAQLEQRQAKLDSAVSLWTKCYKITEDPRYLKDIASLWLSADNPNKAIRAVRSAIATRGPSVDSAPNGQVFLANLFVHLEMLDEARAELELARSSEVLSEELKSILAVLEARLLSRAGKLKEANRMLLSLIEQSQSGVCKDLDEKFFDIAKELHYVWNEKSGMSSQSRPQPSPRLSTP